MDSVGLSDSLSTLLREGTRAQHVRAERSGFIADLLRGRGQRAGYVLLLRNLLPAYRALEQGLEHHGASPVFAGLAWPALFRASALERDLDAFNEPLPPLKDFILPGGGAAAAHCHVARTVARRAERDVIALSRVEPVRAQAIRYLNRLSDLLFVIARVLARARGPARARRARDPSCA